MTIMASARVPAASRLMDLPTETNLPVRPADRIELGRRAWGMLTAPGATTNAVAAQLGLPAEQLYQLSLDYIGNATGWTPMQRMDARAALPGDPALCPAWCDGNHDNEAERLHLRHLSQVDAPHGVDLHGLMEIRVDLEAFESPALPGGIDPTTIHMEMGEPGDVGVAATLTPELAEQLAAALFEAARVARKARR